MRDLTQEKFDKLIAIASSMHMTISYATSIFKIQVETCHGVNAGNLEMISLEEIDEFLEEVFECEVE